MSVKEMIAARAARELKGPVVINLGIGIPTLIPKYVDDPTVFIQTENGMLGVGPRDESRIDPNLVDSGKEFITELPGASSYNKFQVNKFSISRFRDARDTIAVGQQGQVL